MAEMKEKAKAAPSEPSPALSFDSAYQAYSRQLLDRTEKELQAVTDRQLEFLRDQLAGLSKMACEALAKVVQERQNALHELRKQQTRAMDHETQKVRDRFETMTAAWAKEREAEMSTLEKRLIADPTRLLDRVKKETQRLQQERQRWEQRQKQQEEIEARIAKYAGREASEAHKRDWVRINVGGTRFETYRKTLTSVPGSLLTAMFGERSDELFRDAEGVYHLDRDPETFGKVLTILRMRGNVPLDLAITPTLRAEMTELKLLEAYPLPSRLATVSADGHVFAGFRSTAIAGNILRWDVADACSFGAKECVVREADNTQVKILKSGLFRVTVRCVIATEGHKYVELRKGTTNIARCYQCCNSGTGAKTYVFEEIVPLNAGEFLQVYAQVGHCTEPSTNYLSIELLPKSQRGTWARYRSTSSNSNYRQWSTCEEAIPSLAIGNSNKELQCTKGGVFRVTARLHTYYNGNNTYGALYLNGSQYAFSYQGNHSGQHYCQVMLDDIVVMSHQNQKFSLYDGGYGSSNTVQQEALFVQEIRHSTLVGYWMSSASTATNHRKWDKECMNSGVLFTRTDEYAAIQIEEHGYYRVCVCATNRFQGDTMVELLVDGTATAVSRVGCGGGNYYHTGRIAEILRLAKGAKVSVRTSHPYNNQANNRLLIERLVCLPAKEDAPAAP